MDNDYINSDQYYIDMLVHTGLPEDEAKRMVEDFNQGY